MTRFVSAAILFVLLASGCRDLENPEYRFTRFSMGTVVEYTLAAKDETSARTAVAQAHEQMEHVSRLLWEDDSLSVLFAFNAAAESLLVPDEAAEFLWRIRELAQLTGGSFDPTVKPLVDLYDFDGTDTRPPQKHAIDSALTTVGIEGLKLGANGHASKGTPDLALAVGAVAKGYAVDRAIEVLRIAGIKSAIVNAGGDLRCLGARDSRPWNVGLRHPDDPADVVVVLQIADAAVATSGDYQRFYEHEGIRYHHILDPFTGQPARGVRSATVVASTAERADALATALFVRGSRDGLKMISDIPDAEGLIIDTSGAVHYTQGMESYISDDSGSSHPMP